MFEKTRDVVSQMQAAVQAGTPSPVQRALNQLIEKAVEFTSGEASGREFVQAEFNFRLSINELRDQCPECRGDLLDFKGRDQNDDPILDFCETCKGKGWVWKEQHDAH